MSSESFLEFSLSDEVVIKLSIPQILFHRGRFRKEGVFGGVVGKLPDHSHSSRVQKEGAFLSYSDALLQVQIKFLDDIQFVQEVLA